MKKKATTKKATTKKASARTGNKTKQVNMRLTPELIRMAKSAAAKKDMPMTTYLCQLISDALK